MSKDQMKLFDDVDTVTYDFSVDTIVCVEAPVGTDPDSDSIWEALYNKLALKVREKDLTFRFENIFDPKTGVYDEDWKNYSREKED